VQQPARTENNSQAKNDGLFHATAGASSLGVDTLSGAQILTHMGTKITENLGKCVENKADYVPIINNAAAGTSHEEGDVGTSTSSNVVGGMCIFMFITYKHY
jgi:hypothetical protein